MEEMHTMVRTHIAVNDEVFHLAQGQEVDDIKKEIELAAQSATSFVDFIVVGNRVVSVLISTHSRVVVSTETVQYDPRDTGDDDIPYGGMFDF